MFRCIIRPFHHFLQSEIIQNTYFNTVYSELRIQGLYDTLHCYWVSVSRRLEGCTTFEDEDTTFILVVGRH